MFQIRGLNLGFVYNLSDYLTACVAFPIGFYCYRVIVTDTNKNNKNMTQVAKKQIKFFFTSTS